MNKRKCKAFMFPTKSKSNIQLQMNGKLHLENGSSICLNSYQHIYITSDEKIEEDDWYIDDCDKIRRSVTSDEEYWSVREDYKKIIVTTNKFITIDGYDSSDEDAIVKCYLPQPSQEFIETYVKAYNEGNPITEVIVEYEIICGRCYSNTNECWSAKECSRNTDFPDIVRLKVNSDNTINIKPIKDNWNREEVKQLCKLAFKYHCDNSRTTSLPDKWFEENI